MEHNVEVRVNGTINPVDFDYNSRYEVCLSKGTLRSSFLHGVWHGDNPFRSVLPITLLQIFLFLISSRLIYFLLRPIRTPNFVCSVLAGILLGPSVIGQNKKLRNLLFPPVQNEILRFMATMASIYYIFIVIMKMEAVSNLKNAIKTWRFGTIPFLSSFWVMSGLLYFLVPNVPSQPDTMQRVRMLLCVTTSVSTFPVMSENLFELNLLTSELGQVAISATALNEIAYWVFVAVSTAIDFKAKGMNALGYMCSYIAFICFCVFAIKPAMLMIAKRTPEGMPISQGYVVLIQIGVLAMGALSNQLGISILIGPFLLGLVMPHGSALATTVVDRTEGIITHFLVPLFFCYVGLIIDVYSLHSWGLIFKIQLVIIAGFVTKFIACMLISLSYNISLKHGFVLGLMLNFKGINDLIILTKFRRLEIVDDQLFAHWVFSVIGVTAIVSPLIEMLYKPHTRIETYSRSRGLTTIRTIQNTQRNSELCMVLCMHKEGEVRSMISLLESMNPCHESPICVYVIHLIELSGQSTPMLHRVDITKKKSQTHNPSTGHIMRAFDTYARNSDKGSITLLPYINVAPYKSMHEPVVNLAQDRFAPLIIVPFHQNDQSHVGGVAASIRKVNINFLAHAKCTVGLLVDRQSHLRVSSSGLMSLHIGIFFVGGPDDREALALGMRMAERQNSSLVFFRLVVQNHDDEKNKDDDDDEELGEENEEDRRKDESLIDEFRAMKFGRGQVEYREINVKGSEVFERIRRLEGDYDLVMVGRKHAVEIQVGDEEMLESLLDNADMLGVIGDMLASYQFCDGKVPVLVTQCGGGNNNKGKGLGRKASSVAGSHSSFGSRFR
ncbi:hypothetical protein K1719_043929 [Acacia pycnantha]|nr:hypothetical protein K1719_043929 [Acacia pycnantha]